MPTDPAPCVIAYEKWAAGYETDAHSKIAFAAGWYARGRHDASNEEAERLADKLSDCWLFLDELARSNCLLSPKSAAAALLRLQQAPGWETNAGPLVPPGEGE